MENVTEIMLEQNRTKSNFDQNVTEFSFYHFLLISFFAFVVFWKNRTRKHVHTSLCVPHTRARFYVCDVWTHAYVRTQLRMLHARTYTHTDTHIRYKCIAHEHTFRFGVNKVRESSSTTAAAATKLIANERPYVRRTCVMRSWDWYYEINWSEICTYSGSNTTVSQAFNASGLFICIL